MQERFFVYLDLTDPPTGVNQPAGVLFKNQRKYQLAEFEQWLKDTLPLVYGTRQILEGTHAVLVTCTSEEVHVIRDNAPHVYNVTFANSPGDFF